MFYIKRRDHPVFPQNVNTGYVVEKLFCFVCALVQLNHLFSHKVFHKASIYSQFILITASRRSLRNQFPHGPSNRWRSRLALDQEKNTKSIPKILLKEGVQQRVDRRAKISDDSKCLRNVFHGGVRHGINPSNVSERIYQEHCKPW